MSPNTSPVPSSDPEFARDAVRLEELTRDLTGTSGTPNALMREHLEAARFYLLGSMPQEYFLTLRLAEQLLPSMEDKNLRSRVADFLKSRPMHESHPT